MKDLKRISNDLIKVLSRHLRLATEEERIKKILSQDSICLGRDSNQNLPK
jgi:hypothetical protein